jgi:hypothetical protein
VFITGAAFTVVSRHHVTAYSCEHSGSITICLCHSHVRLRAQWQHGGMLVLLACLVPVLRRDRDYFLSPCRLGLKLTRYIIPHCNRCNSAKAVVGSGGILVVSLPC